MSSMDVVVNAGGSVSVSSVEGVHVSASDVSVSSSGVVDVSSREVSVVGVDRLEAYGGEEVRVRGLAPLRPRAIDAGTSEGGLMIAAIDDAAGSGLLRLRG